MILTLDVGNSQIFGGVFEDGELTLRFRRAAQPSLSSDELGLFLRRVLRKNGSDPSNVERIALCSVVPELIYLAAELLPKVFRPRSALVHNSRSRSIIALHPEIRGPA